MVGMVSMGGPYSNHLLALAEIGNLLKIRTIGYIKGDESEWKANLFIPQLRDRNMEIRPVSRTLYRQWHEERRNPLSPKEQENWLWVPMGGTDEKSVDSVKSWAQQLLSRFPLSTHFVLPVGSGGTMAGFASALPKNIQLLAIPCWKGDDTYGSVLLKTILGQDFQRNIQWQMDYHFGGFGRSTPELVQFCHLVWKENGFPLEPVYSGKAFYAVSDLIRKNHFPKGSTVVLVHTGGVFPWNLDIFS